MPTLKQLHRKVILCPYVEKALGNPFTMTDNMHYALTKLDGVLHVCPSIPCVSRRGIYCLDKAQLEVIKKMEEKTK